MELVLAKKDLIRYETICEYMHGITTRSQAAHDLGVSEKTITRWANKVAERGLEGLIHGNRGRCPANKVSDEVIEFYVSWYKRDFYDFNFFHAFEFMAKEKQPKISYSTFRRACREAGLGKVRKRRSSRRRVARDRAAFEGSMWQLDGSPHEWNGKDTWSLIRLIDDASSKTPAGRFFPTETTWGCMTVVRMGIERYGVPAVIITDRAGWSKGSSKRMNFSQFVRACEELGIKVIAVNSPESKGRIERSYRTDQDRLIAELRYYGIKTMTDANRYLEQSYFAHWNQARSVEPRRSETRYRSLRSSENLGEIFCIKHRRVINKDQTLQWQNERYRLENKALGNLWKKEVAIHEYEDGTFSVYYGDTKLAITKMPKLNRNRHRWAS